MLKDRTRNESISRNLEVASIEEKNEEESFEIIPG